MVTHCIAIRVYHRKWVRRDIGLQHYNDVITTSM